MKKMGTPFIRSGEKTPLESVNPLNRWAYEELLTTFPWVIWAIAVPVCLLYGVIESVIWGMSIGPTAWRIGTVIAAAASHWALKSKFSLKFPEFGVALLACYVQVSIVAIMALRPNGEPSYLMGQAQVMIGVMVLPLRPLSFILISSIGWIAVLIARISGLVPVSAMPPEWAANTIGTSTLVTLAFLVVHNIRMRAYRYRLALEQETTKAIDRLGLIETEAAILKEKNLLSRQVAHDLRSPVGALKAALMGLSGETVPLAKAAAERVFEIANDLLSKNTQASDARAITRLNVREELQRIIVEKRLEFEHLGSDWLAEPPIDGPALYVEANRALFRRVLSNLINNAVEAQRDHPRTYVAISVERALSTVRVHIDDQGAGFPPQVLNSLGFEPISFGKGTSGHGLGLFGAITAVRNWGGELNVQNQTSGGARVTVKLPLVS